MLKSKIERDGNSIYICTGKEDRGAHDTALLPSQGGQQDTLPGVFGPAGIFSPEA